MSFFPQHSLTRVPFKQGQRVAEFPINPPGRDYNARPYDPGSALFAETTQVTTLTLGGSTSTGDVTTVTITPTATAKGSPWAEYLGPMSFAFTTGSTETIAAVTAGLDADAFGTISTVAGVSSAVRLRDLVSVTSTATTVVISARDAGIRFTVATTQLDNQGAASSVTVSAATVGDSSDKLKIGIVGVQTAVGADGQRQIDKPAATSAASAILGVVRWSSFAAPAESGRAFDEYNRGDDVVFARSGSSTVYAEKGCAVDAQVYVRKTATTGEIAGAVTDTATTDTKHKITITPTSASEKPYEGLLTILDFWTGEVVAQGYLKTASDDSPSAGEVVTGLKASLAENTAVDALVTDTGTDTLILEADAGYTLRFEPTAEGVLAVAQTTPAASDHMLYPGAKFLETTTTAGPQAIYVAP